MARRERTCSDHSHNRKSVLVALPLPLPRNSIDRQTHSSVSADVQNLLLLLLLLLAQSWGRAAADDGYYVMTKEWFEEWMYQVAIDVGILSPDVAEVLSKPAELLPAWDPMGSLAGGGDGATAAMSRL